MYCQTWTFFLLMGLGLLPLTAANENFEINEICSNELPDHIQGSNLSSYTSGVYSMFVVIPFLIILGHLSKKFVIGYDKISPKLYKILTFYLVVVTLIFLTFALTAPQTDCMSKDRGPPECSAQLWVGYFACSFLAILLVIDTFLSYYPSICRMGMTRYWTVLSVIFSSMSAYVSATVFLGLSPFSGEDTVIIAVSLSVIDTLIYIVIVFGAMGDTKMTVAGELLGGAVVIAAILPTLLVVVTVSACGGGHKSAGIVFVLLYVLFMVIRNVLHFFILKKFTFRSKMPQVLSHETEI